MSRGEEGRVEFSCGRALKQPHFEYQLLAQQGVADVGAIAIVPEIVAPILSLTSILWLGCGFAADVRADTIRTRPTPAASAASATTAATTIVSVGVGVGVFARALGEYGLIVADGTSVPRREVEHEERSAQQAAHADAHKEGWVADERACFEDEDWNGEVLPFDEDGWSDGVGWALFLHGLLIKLINTCIFFIFFPTNANDTRMAEDDDAP